MSNKSEIRKMMKAVKSEFEPMMVSFAGQVIGYKVMALDEYKDTDIIFIYVDYNKEVCTETLIEDALKNGKKVAVPKVYKHELSSETTDGSYMKFHYITSMDDLTPGYNGIKEPDSQLPVADYDSANAVMIMPVVAFDKEKNRVGYGGGYYDKYLDSHQVAYKIGIAYEEQKVDTIDDISDHDIKVDIIITQKDVYR